MTRRGGPRLFCFGIGFSAEALINHLPVAEWTVAGTVRDPDKARQLLKTGIDAQIWSGEKPGKALVAKLHAANHVLISVPPGEDGDPVLNAAADAIRSIPSLNWVGYLSTTGVYGDTGGAWVNETADLHPSSDRSKRRVEAEQGWLRLYQDHGVPVHIFRLAGIYGPGRSVFNQIRNKRAKRIDKPGHAFSRIHVDDIARVLAASIAKPNPGAIYNVCDNEPAPPAEVTAYACGLLGIDPPPLEDFDKARERMSPMALSFWNDNRRVDNARIRNELGIKFRHPDYRSGLQEILVEEA
ncbi:MAG: SDR family oxidoreductase [Rhodospirillales bacterium]|nr:SDR family oxidoreductase [Rhodospirillales bacterium]MBO6788602.1 SDR family oxidoreductase [Rhodospirillales bacterium]